MRLNILSLNSAVATGAWVKNGPLSILSDITKISYMLVGKNHNTSSRTVFQLAFVSDPKTERVLFLAVHDLEFEFS